MQWLLFSNFFVCRGQYEDFEDKSGDDLALILRYFYVCVRMKAGKVYSQSSYRNLWTNNQGSLRSPPYNQILDLRSDKCFLIANNVYLGKLKWNSRNRMLLLIKRQLQLKIWLKYIRLVLCTQSTQSVFRGRFIFKLRCILGDEVVKAGRHFQKKASSWRPIIVERKVLPLYIISMIKTLPSLRSPGRILGIPFDHMKVVHCIYLSCTLVAVCFFKSLILAITERTHSIVMLLWGYIQFLKWWKLSWLKWRHQLYIQIIVLRLPLGLFWRKPV